MLQVRPEYGRRKAADGTYPRQKVGRYVRFTAQQVDVILALQTLVAQPAPPPGGVGITRVRRRPR